MQQDKMDGTETERTMGGGVKKAVHNGYGTGWLMWAIKL